MRILKTITSSKTNAAAIINLYVSTGGRKQGSSCFPPLPIAFIVGWRYSPVFYTVRLLL